MRISSCKLLLREQKMPKVLTQCSCNGTVWHKYFKRIAVVHSIGFDQTNIIRSAYKRQTSEDMNIIEEDESMYLGAPANNTNLLNSLKCIRQKREQIPSPSHNVLQKQKDKHETSHAAKVWQLGNTRADHPSERKKLWSESTPQTRDWL